jgi:hypothetical protein
MRLSLAVFVLVVLVAALPVAISGTLDESGTQQTVVNETFAPSTSPTTLNESHRDDALYNRTVTVYNSSGVLITQPSNYTWHQGNGTIEATSGGELAGEPSANITYGYLDATEDQVALQGLFAEIPTMLAPVFILLLVLVYLRAVIG